ncbi:MAG: L-threonylcarbamoyladenylate synthase [Thermoleophilia bacterium]
MPHRKPVHSPAVSAPVRNLRSFKHGTDKPDLVTEIIRQKNMTPADRDRLRAALYQGALVVLPSDTVYGLACLATIPGAVQRIYEVKDRLQDKPVALVFSSIEQIFTMIPDLPVILQSALGKLLPGPVTAIIPFKEGGGGIETHGAGSIGVRIVPSPAGDIYNELPGPLAVTSANLSRQPDTSAVGDIPEKILAACDFVIDAGRCRHQVPSTVIDLRPLTAGAPPVILRRGAMSREEIEERTGWSE